MEQKLAKIESRKVKAPEKSTLLTIVSPLNIDNTTKNSISKAELSESSHQQPIEYSILDKSIQLMIKNRKFKRFVQFDEESNDDEGFNVAVITEIEETPFGFIVYWVMPKSVKDSLDEYKQILNKTYENESIPKITSSQDIVKFKPHLVITKIEGNWCRAQILSFSEPDILALEDIDSGKKVIKSLPNDVILIPNEAELSRLAYAFKVQFENADECKVECGEVVEIRITHLVPYGISWAEVKMESESPIDETKVELEMTKEKEGKCLFINDIQIKECHLGPKIKLMFSDGSKLEKGKLHVCEGIKENWAFYEDLTKSISEYIKTIPIDVGYQPW